MTTPDPRDDREAYFPTKPGEAGEFYDLAGMFPGAIAAAEARGAATERARLIAALRATFDGRDAADYLEALPTPIAVERGAMRSVVEAARRIHEAAEHQIEAIGRINLAFRTDQMAWELQVYSSICLMLHEPLGSLPS